MTIAISLLSILFLIVLHELGHFLLARKFGVTVEEFGIGMPFTPALFKKKIKGTFYSFYPLIIGAFVKLLGEEKDVADPASFSRKPVSQRMIIVLAGVASSWIVAALLLGFLGTTWGIPVSVSDDETMAGQHLQVQIIGIAPDSPAAKAGIHMGDVILRLQESVSRDALEPQKVADTHDFIQHYKGQEVVMTLQRGKDDIVKIPVVPRVTPPSGEGAVGIVLARTGFIQFPWYEAPVQGAIMTGKVSLSIVQETGQLIKEKIQGQGPPLKNQVAGPIGIVSMLQSSFDIGIAHFLYFVSLIAIYLAIFNTIPIPALDGGRALFLCIEAIVKRPLPTKLIQTLILVSFLLLIPFIIWVSVNDIRRIF
ncbi:MAG: site-2 protease family protein [Candidatus Wildermuthbacteria bacterium]|nr:site-2 protease family protein [Candidatus Wildermuthbacteria bacterium]